MEQAQANRQSAMAVLRRFADEVEYIERYVQLLQAKSTVHDRQVSDINRVLHRVEIKPLPTRDYDRIGKPYSPDEIGILVSAIRAIDPEVYQTILGHEQRLDDIPSFGLDSPAAEHLDRLGDWVSYFIEELSDEPDDNETSSAVRIAIRHAEEAELEVDEEDRMSSDAIQALISLSVDHAMHAKVRERIDEMVYVRQQFDEIDILARMATPNAEINVLRQGFILLMTAFDAAVTDLARIKFRERFFEFLPTFGKNEKMTLEELGQAGSFEVFRDRLIDDQIRRRYIKDLIGLLYAVGLNKAATAASDEQVRLIEMVFRRNVHVHNRGIVDNRYLELDPASRKPKYNLHNLAVGQAAVVDDAYFKDAVKRSSHFVDALSAW